MKAMKPKLLLVPWRWDQWLDLPPFSWDSVTFISIFEGAEKLLQPDVFVGTYAGQQGGRFSVEMAFAVLKISKSYNYSVHVLYIYISYIIYHISYIIYYISYIIYHILYIIIIYYISYIIYYMLYIIYYIPVVRTRRWRKFQK